MVAQILLISMYPNQGFAWGRQVVVQGDLLLLSSFISITDQTFIAPSLNFIEDLSPLWIILKDAY